MTWQTMLQLFTGTFASLGAWFLYDLIREFKSFKSETKTDVFNLKQERNDFKTTVRNAELSIALRVTDLQRLHSDFATNIKEQLFELKNEIKEIREITNHAKHNSQQYADFLKKALELCRFLDQKLKTQEREIKSIQIKLDELIILKQKPS